MSNENKQTKCFSIWLQFMTSLSIRRNIYLYSYDYYNYHEKNVFIELRLYVRHNSYHIVVL